MIEEQVVLRFEDTTKRYGFRPAVSNVSVDFPLGSVIGLIGPNGSGKSTLLKIAAGLVRSTSGRVWANGNIVNGRVRTGVSLLPDTNALYSFHSVSDTLDYFARAYVDFNVQKAKEISDFMELDMGQKVSHLSKGNYSRLKLVIALAREAPLVLMDEPLSGLDPIVRKSILKSLISFVEVERQTIVLSTHEVSEIEPVLDYVALIHEGKLKGFDMVDQIRLKHNQSLVEWMEATVTSG